MNNQRKFLLMVFSSMFIILAACTPADEESTSVDGEKEVNDETKIANESNSSMNVESNKSNEIDEDPTIKEEDSTETKKPIRISSGEEAVEFLKQQLKEGKDDNISFGASEDSESDSNGTYYTVQLVDVSLRASGKTGNLGYYRVYQDGTYELDQLSASNNVRDNSSEDKERYLSKLNEIEKEMETLRENSEAITTLDMEKEEAHRYEIWDKQLNEIYAVLMEEISKEQADQLRDEQRNWIKYKDETAKEESQTYEGGSMESLHYVATQATLTKDRCFELVSVYMN
ncbi:lysozyme inhibitor LprI family protein [Allobacillus sp. GCM10007491]|uniref:DUF1311 domain-containing protein n=1 Tax=Allobacillus saliphilus TaxID=2912308 RepID=A0A941CXZ4_9BACI|nr:lysozyme inhibitor LprI family protein [Allobacillus saliphilus]MBR7554660.1 DUF1311 domain-containing protein [Allobacillus saliphilus]